MRGLNDSSGKEKWLLEHGFYIMHCNAVLPVFRSIPLVPLEVIRLARQVLQPSCRFGVLVPFTTSSSGKASRAKKKRRRESALFSLDTQPKERARFCTHAAKLCQSAVRPRGIRTCWSTIRNRLAQSVARWIFPVDHRS